jgi:hypothetical protein
LVIKSIAELASIFGCQKNMGCEVERNKQNGLPMEEENTVSSWNAKLS